MNKQLSGQIQFKDPQKNEYTVEEILELVKHNFGYDPFPKSHQEKRTYKPYKNSRQTILRCLEGEELPTSTSHKFLFSKASIIKAFNKSLYSYFLKQAKLQEEYKKQILNSQKALQDKFASLTLSVPNASYEDNMKMHIKLSIMFDYIQKNLIDIDEELIDSDIAIFSEIGGLPLDSLSDSEILATNRILGNYQEYYTVKQQATSAKTPRKHSQ